jgi:hypothetical protein
MRADLGALLNRHRNARDVFAALWLVECSLARRRSDSLERLNVEIVRRAAAQLARITSADESIGIAMLRSRLTALGARIASTPSETLKVSDASLSMFFEAEHEWEQQVTRSAHGNSDPGHIRAGI